MLTNFPNGVTSFGVPLIGSGPVLTTGKVFFVDSVTGSNGNDGQSPERPFSTLDYAVGRCTASKGDHIIAMPGHTETITAAAGLDLDVQGITLIGVGHGADRPTINYTTAVGADMDVDAAAIRMYNFLFTGGVDALTGPIDVNSADFDLGWWEWRDVTGQATDVVVAVSADRMHLHNFIFDGAAAAGADSGIAMNAGDNARIHDFEMDGNFAVGGIDVRTTACTDLRVYDCWYFRTRNATDVFVADTITASTGQIGPNCYLRLADNAANITEAITGATWVIHNDISIVNLAGELGMLTNITASTDA